MASVSARPAGPRLRLRTRAGVVALAACGSIVVVAPPASAGCDLLDPGCVQDTVTGTVEDPVGTATRAAGGIVDQVGGTLDGLLGRGPADPPGNGGGGGGGGGPTTPPVGGGSGQGSAGRPHHVPGGAPAREGVPAPGAAAAGDVPGSSVDTRTPDPEGGLLDQIGGAAGGVARRLGFPMALAMLVLLFAALQNRVDRNDPRMARAPMVPDVMRFG